MMSQSDETRIKLAPSHSMRSLRFGTIQANRTSAEGRTVGISGVTCQCVVWPTRLPVKLWGTSHPSRVTI
ncbi:hypothetical protein RRG08_034401 [Elysia crispata]|uniref:Uncharacterized protein n=1 Tax=Elysia crispata TaxID=231223 RepID=A0AAE0YDG6_9GAST|nr:hypothetical protein RRG08_034401 [Elysia crispata]